MDEQNQQPINNEQKAELTKHEKKQLKREQKHEEKQQTQESKSNKELKRKITKYSIAAAIIILIILGGYYFIVKPVREFNPIHKGFYHWHSNIEVSVCGEPAKLRCGAGMCGPMTLHHHNDDIIHIEGNTIAKEEDISLGKFLDGINLEFSGTNLFGKNNGDLCPNGQQGTVKMYVNGQPNMEFDNYILNRCESQNIKQDCEKIELKFE